MLLVAGSLPAAYADSIRDGEWQLDHVRATQAWGTTRGAGVVVAVVDTGVDASHPDLEGNVTAGTSLTGASADGRTDPDGHGTAMAGIIAAHGEGDAGVIGIAPEATILPVDATSNGSADLVPAGIRWATDNGADVINLSIGSPDTAELRDAVAYAEDAGVVVVAAAGNLQDESGAVINPDRTVEAPGSYPGLISASAINEDNELTELSAHGPEVDVTAPGQDVVTDLPDGQYGRAAGGTSSAAAIVSGVVALVMAAHPDLDAANVINRVIASAKDLGQPGVDSDLGAGLVDAKAAVSADVDDVRDNPLGSMSSSDPPATTDPPAQTTAPASPSCDTSSGPGGAATPADEPDAPGGATGAPPPSGAAAPGSSVAPAASVRSLDDSCAPVTIPPLTGAADDGASGLPIAVGVGVAVVLLAIIAVVLVARRRSRQTTPGASADYPR